MEYNFVFNACGRYPKVTYESAVWKEWPRHTDPLYKRMISNSILHYFIHFVEKLKNPRHTRDKCTCLHVSRRETTFQEICIGTDRWHHFSLLYFFQRRMNGNMIGNRIRIVTNFPRNFIIWNPPPSIIANIVSLLVQILLRFTRNRRFGNPSSKSLFIQVDIFGRK